MSRRIAAGLLGYAVLVLVYVIGAVVTWAILAEPPFRPESGALTMSWMAALLLTSVVGGMAAGWVSRRVGHDRQSVAVLIAILVGLALSVVLTDMLIGPTASGRAFVEALFGPVPAELPFGELLDGRPQAWFAVTSYVVAIFTMVAGAALAERTGASTVK